MEDALLKFLRTKPIEERTEIPASLDVVYTESEGCSAGDFLLYIIQYDHKYVVVTSASGCHYYNISSVTFPTLCEAVDSLIHDQLTISLLNESIVGKHSKSTKKFSEIVQHSLEEQAIIEHLHTASSYWTSRSPVGLSDIIVYDGRRVSWVECAMNINAIINWPLQHELIK